MFRVFIERGTNAIGVGEAGITAIVVNGEIGKRRETRTRCAWALVVSIVSEVPNSYLCMASLEAMAAREAGILVLGS
jgi:hypothetical protein